jgi:hypothetical protein
MLHQEFFLLCLSTFIISKKGNIFSSGTRTTTSSTVTTRRKRGKRERCRGKKIQTVTAVVRTTDREFNHQTSSPLLLYHHSIDSIIDGHIDTCVTQAKNTNSAYLFFFFFLVFCFLMRCLSIIHSLAHWCSSGDYLNAYAFFLFSHLLSVQTHLISSMCAHILNYQRNSK